MGYCGRNRLVHLFQRHEREDVFCIADYQQNVPRDRKQSERNQGCCRR